MTLTLSQTTTPTTPTIPLPASTQAREEPGKVRTGTTLASAAAYHAAPQGGQFLARLMPSDEGERQAQAMENWLQACASDEPFALELVGTRREQGFLLRASSAAQLTLLCKQLEAQYPQAEIQRFAPWLTP